MDRESLEKAQHKLNYKSSAKKQFVDQVDRDAQIMIKLLKKHCTKKVIGTKTTLSYNILKYISHQIKPDVTNVTCYCCGASSILDLTNCCGIHNYLSCCNCMDTSSSKQKVISFRSVVPNEYSPKLQNKVNSLLQEINPDLSVAYLHITKSVYQRGSSYFSCISECFSNLFFCWCCVYQTRDYCCGRPINTYIQFTLNWNPQTNINCDPNGQSNSDL